MVDLRLKGDGSEKIVGAGHPTLPDTVNRLSQVAHDIDGTHRDGLSIGGAPGSLNPTLRKCTINPSTGDIINNSGPDLMLNSASTSTPDQQFAASKIWAATFNDFADYLPLEENEKIIYGKAYYFNSGGKLQICSKRCQAGSAGISSDGFGISTGKNPTIKTVPISIGGIVLAFVDHKYKTGTPLVSSINGNLTKAKIWEKIFFPERILAIYLRKNNDGRHFVKV